MTAKIPDSDRQSADRGAHFFRCDFQVHTPRDQNWRGRRPHSRSERETYADVFVAKCRELGLHAVAITDHHDLVYAPLIRAAASRETDANGRPLDERERLVVFPGVELTLGVPCQALLLLDADFPDDRLDQVLDVLNINKCDPEAERLPDVTRLDHIDSLRQLYGLLDQRDWLKGRYIVLPNVTDTGHASLMRSGMQAKYIEMPCVGGYLDGSVEQIGTGNKTKFAGDDKAWGNKPLAIFQTSDSRRDDRIDLGKYSTWVKWAEPTAEALRQACLAADSRLSQELPNLPAIYVSRLVVTNSKFLGHVDISFNRQYNAIIGGRGTGKSTLLDYLRWGLCDQPADMTNDDLANPTTRRQQLISNTLAPMAGQVEVHFSINEIPHVVRRTTGKEELTLKVGSKQFAVVRESEIRSLLPIHAYSQKQLSGVSLRQEELTRFVTAPIQSKLDSLDQRIQEHMNHIRENYARLQRARELDGSIDRGRLSIESLDEQARNLRTSLTDLSDTERAVMDDKPGVDGLRDELEGWQQDLTRIDERVSELKEVLDRASRRIEVRSGLPLGVARPAEELAEANKKILADFRFSLLQARDALTKPIGPRQAYESSLVEVKKALDHFDKDYKASVARSSANEARLEQLAVVDERRRAAAALLEEQERERADVGDPREDLASLRARLRGLYDERSTCLSAECDRLTELSDGLIRAHVVRARDLGDIKDRFRAMIQGSGVRGAKVDAFFTALAQESNPLETWELVLDELEELRLWSDNAGYTSEVTPTLSRLGLPTNDQRRMQPRLTPDGWLNLALTKMGDEPVFEYRTREGEFIAFSAASAGQQATALLKVLLAQTGMPLVVDQPEEDLDSEIVESVVRQVWKAKQQRQIIFASHNANLVVNGDAELVIGCDYRTVGDQSSGHIKVEGAIDVASVRDEITLVMEGGEKAFRLRKEKYGF